MNGEGAVIRAVLQPSAASRVKDTRNSRIIDTSTPRDLVPELSTMFTA